MVRITREIRNMSMFSLVLVIFLIWILLFFFISLIILIKDPVSFVIGLNKNTFDRPDTLLLNYKISNWWPIDITNVNVDISILEKEGLEKIDTPADFNMFNSIEGNYSLNVNPSLPIGDYTILANLTYVDIRGNNQSKDLTLGFKVVS